MGTSNFPTEFYDWIAKSLSLNRNFTHMKQPFLKIGTSSISSIQFSEINSTFPTFQGISERRVWIGHFGKLADRNVSEADNSLMD